MIIGLEGALHSGARSRGYRKEYGSARGVVTVMDSREEIDHQHALLLTHLYGHHNEGRHGRRTDRRTASILCMVGALIWLEEFAKLPTLSWIGRQLDRRLMELAEAPAEPSTASA